MLRREALLLLTDSFALEPAWHCCFDTWSRLLREHGLRICMITLRCIVLEKRTFTGKLQDRTCDPDSLASCWWSTSEKARTCIASMIMVTSKKGIEDIELARTREQYGIGITSPIPCLPEPHQATQFQASRTRPRCVPLPLKHRRPTPPEMLISLQRASAEKYA